MRPRTLRDLRRPATPDQIAAVRRIAASHPGPQMLDPPDPQLPRLPETHSRGRLPGTAGPLAADSGPTVADATDGGPDA